MHLFPVQSDFEFTSADMMLTKTMAAGKTPKVSQHTRKTIPPVQTCLPVIPAYLLPSDPFKSKTFELVQQSCSRKVDFLVCRLLAMSELRESLIKSSHGAVPYRTSSAKTWCPRLRRAMNLACLTFLFGRYSFVT